MSEYIKREDALEIVKRTSGDYAAAFSEIARLPGQEVVSLSAYKQVAWERDLAIHQLRVDYGVGLGEKPKQMFADGEEDWR